MKYRKFGPLDLQVSALGFGCMRLPTLGESSRVDEAEAIRMIRYAIDHGVSYVDTAWGYHGGNSEIVVGKALRDGYRERVYLATKLPVWLVKEKKDFHYYLGEQLKRLQTDHIDFYLLHSLGAERWRNVVALDVLEEAEKAVADGRVGYLGFSFHDSFEVFKEIVDGYDRWTFCQIQYNYLNEEVQAGTAGLQYAASKGLGVVIMEPLLGGRLANPPAAVRRIFESAAIKRSPAEWALQWLWNKPEISTVLSGMTTMEQVKENVAAAERSGIGTMTEEELEIIARAVKAYESLCPISCTKCEYCMPCPNGVNIPGNFTIYNEGVMFDDREGARRRYQRMEAAERAENCIGCRECEQLCPQGIPISEWMPTIHEVLSHEQVEFVLQP